MSEPPSPERDFLNGLRHHKAWGIFYVTGCVLLAGYLLFKLGKWLAWWP